MHARSQRAEVDVGDAAVRDVEALFALARGFDEAADLGVETVVELAQMRLDRGHRAVL
ncbi:hypothetical protein ACFSLT_31245 [Novosphingobium resinovorum]